MGLIIFLLMIAIVAVIFSFFSKKYKMKFSESNEKDHESISRVLKYSANFSWGIFGGVIGLNTFIIVPSGTVYVGKMFGVVQPYTETEGIHFVNPLVLWNEVNIQRNAITVDDGDSLPGMLSTTKDNIQANVKANFTFMVNPNYAWWLTKYVGDNDKIRIELLEKAAQSATRDALAFFQLEEAQITKRAKFEEKLKEEFFENILINLPLKELSETQRKSVFIILPTQLMNISPDPKVANALSEKKATEINLENQINLTAIATEQANRRESEGKGIRKLFDQLPSGYSANDVAIILNATANKERADALMKAVTDGKVSSIVFEGSGDVSKTVK